jgi:hypothetical protein
MNAIFNPALRVFRWILMRKIDHMTRKLRLQIARAYDSDFRVRSSYWEWRRLGTVVARETPLLMLSWVDWHLRTPEKKSE